MHTCTKTHKLYMSYWVVRSCKVLASIMVCMLSFVCYFFCRMRFVSVPSVAIQLRTLKLSIYILKRARHESTCGSALAGVQFLNSQLAFVVSRLAPKSRKPGYSAVSRG